MTYRSPVVRVDGAARYARNAWRPLFFSLLLALMLFAPLSGMAQIETIKPGTVINVTVVGHPEFSQLVIVHQDGTTDYPLLGNIPVDGMTAEDLKELLTRALNRVVDRPLVFVNLSHYAMIEMRVVGAVQSPGDTEVRGPADIQSVLASVGGPLENADLRRIAIIREKPSGQVIEEVDLFTYAAQDAADFTPVYVGSGDLVVVPLLERDSYVRVIGAVNLPGPYVPTLNANVIDMIYLAGGPSRQADLNNIRFIRSTMEPSQREVELDMEDMLERGSDYPPVHPGDVIIVSFRDDWKTFSFWAGFMRDLALVASSILILSRI
ncbi:polysaccharide biosynthesis/export family protein [bacterium]|nr:polysaccharide biosynthesis/export family protein [bacterium]